MTRKKFGELCVGDQIYYANIAFTRLVIEVITIRKIEEMSDPIYPKRLHLSDNSMVGVKFNEIDKFSIVENKFFSDGLLFIKQLKKIAKPFCKRKIYIMNNIIDAYKTAIERVKNKENYHIEVKLIW